LIAYGLQVGEIQIAYLTRQQAIAVTDASASYVATLARCTAEDLARIKENPFELSRLHNRRRGAEFDHIIGELNVLAGLDRLVRPAVAAE
jgi:hypothetical protein